MLTVCLVETRIKRLILKDNEVMSECRGAYFVLTVYLWVLGKIGIIMDGFNLSYVSRHQDSFVSVVTAVNKEVLSGTDAVEISCEVTGLTAALKTVKWTNSGGTDVTTLTESSSYTVNAGTLEGGNSQTTTLTVAAAQTTADANYNCVITPASQDDETEVSTSVALNIYSKSDMLRLFEIQSLNFHDFMKEWICYRMVLSIIALASATGEKTSAPLARTQIQRPTCQGQGGAEGPDAGPVAEEGAEGPRRLGRNKRPLGKKFSTEVEN